VGAPRGEVAPVWPAWLSNPLIAAARLRSAAAFCSAASFSAAAFFSAA
jgi:hypothetical protein